MDKISETELETKLMNTIERHTALALEFQEVEETRKAEIIKEVEELKQMERIIAKKLEYFTRTSEHSSHNKLWKDNHT